ncbi:MAG: hypothetical protein AVDCRST_MAG53-3108 [uncultured Solirubrobacteraceae bacterium]|uniref:DUF4331 domain-containing protein n=1 Tax=uncultured Solirubrobacteraceae bacterium TaxID=1162706 RepID=A0A6J4T886_9ACTN|nr:MAG: hypothetical protein AVDCRST_MAG53-3108 [uncultured Solirubrobacteraceae bacterium]
MKKFSALAVMLAALVAVALSSGSSHREAPNIMLDPAADNTDTYAFTANDAPGKLTVVANWVPGGNPANGPNFFRFDDRARYYISIDNTGEGKPDVRYRFVFKTVVSDTSYRQAQPGVSSFDDPKLQQKQRYSIVRETFSDGKVTGEKTIATDLPVAPPNAGRKTFPDYDRVAAAANRTVGDSKYFAGQRDDAFFIDLGAAFDNINLRLGTGNTGGGTDTQSGTSIETITMQVPEAEVTRDGKSVSGPDAANAVVGVWATTERRKIEVTNSDFDSNAKSRGAWVQVSRLGAPLTNELFVPAGLKDSFNRRRPDTDDRLIRKFFLEPEFAKQINSLSPVGLNAPEKDRTDLVDALLRGMPGLNQIDKANPVPTDTLKINLGTMPSQTPNRFGVIGGDNAGFPNGRRLEDDVVDIYVQLFGGFLKGNKLPAGDGVDQNDKAFLDTFPYQAAPTGGFEQAVSERDEPLHAPTLPGNNPALPIGPR